MFADSNLAQWSRSLLDWRIGLEATEFQLGLFQEDRQVYGRDRDRANKSFKDISYQLRFSGSIYYQRRVPLHFPFLVACKTGDLTLTMQYIINNHELVHYRSICSGKTSLSVSNNTLDSALQGLLLHITRQWIGESWSNAVLAKSWGSNRCRRRRPTVLHSHYSYYWSLWPISSLPVFAALGFNGRRKVAGRQSPFVQFPPETDAWIDTLRSLAEYGPSVHDVVTNRTITMLNLNHDTYSEKTILCFFCLRKECYADFDLVSDQGPSALLMEIRGASSACAAMGFLAENGVDLQHIRPSALFN